METEMVSYKFTEKAPSLSSLHFNHIEDKSVCSYIKSVVESKWLSETEDSHAALSELPGFIKNILQAKQSGKKVVLFLAVTQGSFPSIEYIARAVKERNDLEVFGVYLMSEPPEKVYDHTIFCGESLYVLAEILSHLQGISLYLQAHGRWSFLSQFIKLVNPDLRVVQEVYDWMEAFIGDRELFTKEGLFTDIEIEMIMESEKFIRTETDGYIYKDGGEWIKQKVEVSKAPSLQILPCPPIRLMKEPRLKQKTQKAKLVYAGQVMSKKSLKHIFGDLDYIQIIRDITGQGLSVTVYNSVFYSRIFPEELYDDYLQESKKNDLFQFKTGIRVKEVIDRMHDHFDYGLMIYYFDDEIAVGKEHLRGSMASKLFTYLAAGIPVLISEELQYMAEFVKTHGVGIVVSENQISSLNKIISNADYSGMISNIKKTQRKYNMERYLPGICDLLRI
jgi:hypothetical protein